MPSPNHKRRTLAGQDREPTRSCRAIAQIDHPDQLILWIEPSVAVLLASRKKGIRVIPSPLRAGDIFAVSRLDRIFGNLTNALLKSSGKTAKL